MKLISNIDENHIFFKKQFIILFTILQSYKRRIDKKKLS